MCHTQSRLYFVLFFSTFVAVTMVYIALHFYYAE